MIRRSFSNLTVPVEGDVDTFKIANLMTENANERRSQPRSHQVSERLRSSSQVVA